MADSTPETGQASASGGVPVWERAWTVDEMRKAADDWSLAGDAGMLQYLQDFSQRIISQTHDIQEQVNGLVHESKLTGIRVQNAFNDFIMLANTQFVENRVYDEDVNTETVEKTEKKEEKEKTREEREAALIPKIKEAMLLGFNVIETAFETLDVNDVNSDSEDEEESPYKTDTILEPKDPYLSRPLPYLIGSQAFMTDDDVGLTDVPSEGEESDHGSISESESESDTEPVTQQQKPPSRRPTVLDSDSDSSDEETETESESELFGTKDEDSDVSPVSEDEEEQPKQSETSNFANELAAKLGATETHDKVEKKEKKQAEVKRERAASKHKQTVKPPEDDDEDLFGPPPVEDDDSPFGRQGGLFSTGGGLFDDDDNEGGGLFDDVVPQKPPPAVIPDKQKDEETVKEEKPPEQARARTKSGRKVPVGGISIFAGGDDDLFGTKKKKQESESEEEVVKEPEKPKKQATAPAPLTGGGGLFDDDDDDLFATAAAAPPKKAAPKKEVAPPVDLFGEEDDDGDLFAAAPQPIKKQPPKEEPKPQKKLPAGAVSMFGGNPNPLAAALKAQRPPSDKEDSDDDWEEDDKGSESSSRSGASSSIGGIKPSLQPGGIKKSASPSTSSNSLFAEEPDFLAAKPKPVSTAVGKSKVGAPAASGKGLFADDSEEEDLFATATKPKSNQLENKPKPQKSGLFLDDEDDDGGLFGAAPKAKKQEPVSKTKPKPGGMFDDDLFAEPSDREPPPLDNIPKKSEESSRPRGGTTLSLFDDDADNDEDLFGGRAPPKPKPPLNQPTTLDTKGTKPRTRSLFADDDVLFGAAEDDPSVDLFGADSPLSPSEESKPFPPVAQKLKTQVSQEAAPEARLKDKVEVKGATISASSTDLFSGANDETDLFSAEPNPLSKPAEKMDPKVEVKGATTSESSTDKSAIAAQGKKKPIGGVSMFGGMDPAMLKKRAGSLGKDSDSDTKPTPPELPDSDPMDDEAPIPAPRPKVKPPPTTKPKSTHHAPHSSIGKLQANLMINPSALLPGATPPTKEPQPAPVGFDEPVKASTLSTVHKDRVKGQSRRRPPTRKSRLITGDDLTDSVEVVSPEPVLPASIPAAARVSAIPPLTTSRTSAPSADLFADDEADVFATSRPEPTVSGARAPSRVKESPPDDDLFSDSSLAAAVPSSTSNIFSEAFAKSRQYTKVKGPLDNNVEDDLLANDTKTEKKPIIEDSDDLFGSTSLKAPSSSSKSKTVKPVNLLDDEDDIFASAAAKPPPLPTGPDALDNDVDDIFGDSSLAAKSTSKPLVNNDDDIFSSSQEKKAPPPVIDEDDIFSTAVPKPSKTKAKTPLAFEDDDEDDLFASAKPASSAPKKQSNAASKSAPALDDNIFADLPPAKSREKKVKKKEAKSIFQDDDDDIFAEASSKPKTKKSSMNKKKPAATNIFGNDDDAGDIFDDPLNAIKH